MGCPIDQMLQVETEIRIPIATTQLVQLHVNDPVDIVMFDRDAYWLEMCLTPRPRTARACYSDHWNSQRFERIGNVYVLPPGETIRTRSDGGPSHASVLCHLRPEPMRQWFDDELHWSDRQLEASLDITDMNTRNLLLRLADEMRHPGFASEMLVELIVAQLAIELGRYLVHFDEHRVTGKLAAWRLQLIEERLREISKVPTLDELAGLCNISVRQLTRGFRASRGCSIGEYVANSRIDSAKRLLINGQTTKAIAYALGFSSSSAFSYAFRRATGKTPGEFKTGNSVMHPVAQLG